MKVSYNNNREGNPHHNDRTIDLSKAKHIDPERTKFNKYVCVYPELKDHVTRSGKKDYFGAAEYKFYAENFKEFLDRHNKKVKKQRNYGRKKTVKSLLTNYNTRPEETIIQIGNMYDYPEDRDDLLYVFSELQKYSNKITHHHCKILDAALHMDESTPHIHLRKVWVYKEDGMMMIGQEKALEHAGIPLPEPDQPKGQNNNRKMTYDRMMREKLYELCRDRGLEIDTTPDPENQKHLKKEEYIDKIYRERERAQRMREEKRRKRKEQGH